MMRLANMKVSRSPFKLTLFWRLFLAMLSIVLLTSVLSVLVERKLIAHNVDQRMQKQVAYLMDTQAQIADHLTTGNVAAINTLYRQDRSLAYQLFVTDSRGEVLFPNQHIRVRNPRPPSSIRHRTERSNVNESSGQPFDQRASGQAHPTQQDSFNRYELLPPLASSGREALQAWRDGTELPETTVTLPNGSKASIQLYPRLSYRDISAMRQGYFGLRMALLLVFGVLVCYGLSRTLTGRIRQVQHSVHQLSHGDYQAGLLLNHLGNDELGALGQDIATLSQRLMHSEQARQQMLSDISHELRSPLARLEVATELARDQAPQSASYFDRIQRESARMNALIGQIIHIQSLQMGIGSGAPHKAPCDIVQIIQQIGTDVCFEFQQKQIAWDYHGPQQFVITVDAEQIHSALENIVRNAFMHTPVGQQVQICLSDSAVQPSPGQPTGQAKSHQSPKPLPSSADNNRQLVIEIMDTGEGIKEDEIERIFQPFVRLDSARQRQTGGHGLGLAIAQGVVSAHGGHIQAFNRDDGQSGLVVRIVLPLATDDL